jgi:hypothetical protein
MMGLGAGTLGTGPHAASRAASSKRVGLTGSSARAVLAGAGASEKMAKLGVALVPCAEDVRAEGCSVVSRRDCSLELSAIGLSARGPAGPASMVAFEEAAYGVVAEEGSVSSCMVSARMANGVEAAKELRSKWEKDETCS